MDKIDISDESLNRYNQMEIKEYTLQKALKKSKTYRHRGIFII